MARLGQYLIHQGLISAEQLDEALQHQALYGARLGTNLVDLACITLSELAQQLSTFHRAPLPPREWVTRPNRAAVKTSNRGLVERLRFVPMRLEGKTLHAAVLDPNDPGTLDDLRFATGCRVKAYVLPELAMHDLLARLWNVPRGIRPVDVQGALARLEAARASHEPTQQHAHVSTHRLQDPREIDLDSWEHQQPAAAPARPPDSRQPTGQPSTDTSARRSQGAGNRRARSGRHQPTQPAVVAPSAGAAPPTPSAKPPPPPAAARSASPPPRSPMSENPPPPPIATMRTPLAAPDPTGATLTAAHGIDTAKQLAAVMRGGAVRGRASAPDLREPRQRATAPGILFEPAPPVSNLADMPPPVSNLATQLASIVPDPMPEEDSLPEPPRVSTPIPGVADPDLDLQAQELRVLEAATRDELIEAAMAIACHLAPRVALFVVHQGTIQGAKCRISGSARAIDGVLFPVDADSMLAQVASSGGHARVVPGEHAFDKRLLAMLGDGTPTDAGVFAVSIKSRVVNLLYVDQTAGALPATVYAAITALADVMAQGYEGLILRRKSN